ncbi:hypothetical protein NP945_29315 [Mesorhizobium sp. LMG17149]|uniref:hypothetical protein n=1 Tax=Mesorhizobium sp. LMG17149 TaxID=2968497 RepID=UPI002118EF64|nr:hypothetical protein [Mesorhizobium sp. LMG17149]MCQ8875944.1 hypothetical protein [Mesorhizobium sp. LMG17149]
MAMWFDQQERLKSAKGEELLDSMPKYEGQAANVAPAPADLGGKITLVIGEDGKPVAKIKE